MDCRNCGAPMRLFRERDYYFCEYCGTFHFPSPSTDGVRLLGQTPIKIQCPVCAIPLSMATLDDHHQGFQCQRCQGILLGRSSFRETVQYRRARVHTPPDPPQPLNREELSRRLHCPMCTHVMDTHPFYGPGNIVIDTCARCDLIWLDYGELGRVIGAPGRDLGIPSYREEGIPNGKQNEEKNRAGRRGKQQIDLEALLGKLF